MPVISISMASSPLSPFNSLAPPERESEGGRQNKSAQLSNKRKRGGTASSKKRRGNDGGILLLSLLYGYNNNSCQSGGERRGSRWRSISGIPVPPQQRASTSVQRVNPAPLLSRPPAPCIFAEPLISLVIFKTGPQPALASPLQFRGRRGPLRDCSACMPQFAKISPSLSCTCKDWVD